MTLHQIGVPFTLFERVRSLRPLGVGINIQPNAVRELFDLGLSAQDLDRVGLPAREWAMVGLNGQDIYAEPRGREAGYHWPQYAMHRGAFQMLLAETLIARAGPEVLRLDARCEGYTQSPEGGVQLHLSDAAGRNHTATGSLLIGADGIQSNLRAQMHPDKPPVHWGGRVMWRGTTQARPIRSGSSFVGLGTRDQRLVMYPITAPDPDSGQATINWIAERSTDAPGTLPSDMWFRPVQIDSFAHHFADWIYPWLDVPALLRGTDVAYENPMIDRDPIPTWQDGAVALIGDAAHAMYPTGSNGASQAIVDARVLGASAGAWRAPRSACSL